MALLGFKSTSGLFFFFFLPSGRCLAVCTWPCLGSNPLKVFFFFFLPSGRCLAGGTWHCLGSNPIQVIFFQAVVYRHAQSGDFGL